MPDANEVAASVQRVKQWVESDADEAEKSGGGKTIEVYTYINIFSDLNGNGAVSAATIAQQMTILNDAYASMGFKFSTTQRKQDPSLQIRMGLILSDQVTLL